MLLSTILLSLLPLTLASPTPSTSTTLSQLRADLKASESCSLNPPGDNCAGAPMKDVIVQFHQKLASNDTAGMMLDVVKTSGGKVLYDWNTVGFSAYVPAPVLKMMKAYGSGLGMEVHENACAEIPWCGEAPC